MTRTLIALLAAFATSASLAALACPGDKSCNDKDCGSAKGGTAKVKGHVKHSKVKKAETAKTSDKAAAPTGETKAEGSKDAPAQ
jgi:hypothetical protein